MGASPAFVRLSSAYCEEGNHFRTHSSNNTLQNVTIANTGPYTPGFGEGIYIGSANSNRKTYSNGQPDRSDNNGILNNHLGPDIRAETIDVKEGTSGGTISGNYLDANGITGANYADSWIDVRGKVQRDRQPCLHQQHRHKRRRRLRQRHPRGLLRWAKDARGEPPRPTWWRSHPAAGALS